WTRDSKKGELVIVNGATPSVNGVVAPRELDAAWSRVDPMVNLAVDVTRDVHVYGKWSTGYKSGGANSRSLTYAPFNPETVSMFEIGAKTEFFDRHARFNIAAYAGTYKDIQVDFSANYLQYDPVTGKLLSSTRTTTETTNAPGTGHLKGIEADLSFVPVEGLTVSASYAYTHVSIPATVNPFPQGATGVIVTTPIQIYSVYTPTHAASGSIDYDLPLNGFSLRAHVDANYDSGFYANYNNPGVGLTQPKGESAFIVNGRLAIADIDMGSANTRVTVSAWVRNLLNEQHLFYKTYSALLGTSGFFNDARTFGGEVNVKF
ncbi:MAG: TonB-dependent receptor, partial [bacterium]|nr:TonB-dependent receptor [bacterium]